MSGLAKSHRHIIKPTYKWNENFLEFFNSLITDLQILTISDRQKYAGRTIQGDANNMKEVKSPKKPLAFYYLIILAALLLFNVFVMPSIASRQAKEVDYGTFMSMIEKKNIGDVEIKDSEIVFTDKKETKIYKTGVMDDPTLTERLYDSCAKFTKDIQQTTSPMLSMLNETSKDA